MTQETNTELYRYNVLFIEQESPGLYIITADSCDSIIQQKQGIILENYGDFYSEVQCKDLDNRIYQLLEKAEAAENIKIIAANLFEEKNVDFNLDYIIKSDTGVRLYSPGVHQKDYSLGAEAAYFVISMFFLEDLFSSEKEGSLQREFKQFESLLEKASAALKKAAVEAEELTKDFDKAYKIFDDALKKNLH